METLFLYILLVYTKIKVKESRTRPVVAQRFPGGLGSQISWNSAREGNEIVSLTHRPPLVPGMFLVFIFTRGWVDFRSIVRSEGNMSLKNPVIPPEIDPGTARLIAQRLNHYATAKVSQKCLCGVSYITEETKLLIHQPTKALKKIKIICILLGAFVGWCIHFKIMDWMSNTNKLHYIYDSVFAAEWSVFSAEILRKSIPILFFQLKIKNLKYMYFKLIFWPVLPSILLKRLRKTIWTAVRVSTYVCRFDAHTTKRVCSILDPKAQHTKVILYK